MMLSQSRRARFLALIAFLIGLAAAGLVWNRHRASRRALRDAARTGGQDAPADQFAKLIGAEVSRRPIAVAGAADFVSSEACARCHPEIAQAFDAHPMRHSLAPIASAAPIEDYAAGAFAPPGARRYAVEKRGSRVWHHEVMVKPGGAASPSGAFPSGAWERAETIYDQAVEVAYALGSGTRGRAYLIDRDGQFFVSPINWYTAEHRWDLAPGYAAKNHPRFERLVSEECLFCHAGQTAPAQPAVVRYADPPFRETAIGCERCHGPGRQHAEGETNGAGSPLKNGTVPVGRDDTSWENQSSDRGSPLFQQAANGEIVNPGKLPRDLCDSVCYQCHLHGEARVPRSGQRLADYRPGRPLEETLSIFLRPAPPREAGAPRAVSQSEQMQASACYAGGELRCISCHDPHRVPERGEKMAWYRGKCLTCHAEQGCALSEPDRRRRSREDSCIECHMPAIAAGGIPHAAQTDHRILRDVSQERSANEEPALDDLVLFNASGTLIPDWEQDRARGMMLLALGSGRKDRMRVAAEAEKLLRRAQPFAPDDLDLLHDLGTAVLRQSRQGEALEIWDEVLRRDPDRAQTLLTRGVLCQAIGEYDKSRDSFERLLRLSPWQTEPLGRYAELLAMQGDWDEAAAAARRALDIDPTFVVCRELLAAACLRLGKRDEAQEQMEIAREIQKAASR